MATESEAERIQRIQDDQINARERNPYSVKGHANASPAKKQTPNRSKGKTVTPISENRANSLANTIHDVAVGLAAAAIPAALMLVLLPGGFKLLSIVALMVGGGASFLLGETV